ncbi:hypothetical protein SORBI_3001G192300 [Sorghum bicolor]|uniref:KIB1-4 beta-propeller domain-containing protein n=2 Tax=Sorghum bicolor TaxID=4558 RepID=C5WVC1_SORBI|nr:hypothetical protein SORBI_3001G192300 [Sorghum bicolor]
MERDWASLEQGLLRDIFVRLPSDVDAVHFRRVCPGWRAAAGAGVHVPRPMFILNATDDDDEPVHAFVRPVDRRRHTHVSSVRVDSAVVTGVSVWPPACVRGTSRGWLVVNEDEHLLLRDPISCAEIPLPAFDAGYNLFDVFLSDDPLAAPGSWTAFAFFRWDDIYNPREVLAFCRPGDDDWARVDPVEDGQGQEGQQMRFYRGLEFFRGRPYVLVGKPYRLAVCDVEARRLVMSSVRIFTPAVQEWGWQECLVECGGDLLVVQVAWRDEYTSPWYSLGSHFFEKHKIRYIAKVFKMVFDADDGSGMPVAFEAAASTGDYAVFVAPQGHAFALPASGFPAVRAGCVYFFAVNYSMNVQGMVVIDLQADPRRRDKIVRKMPLAGDWQILSWFCPRPVLDTTPPPPPRRRRRYSMRGLRNAFSFFN